jgi:hypothetical protein
MYADQPSSQTTPSPEPSSEPPRPDSSQLQLADFDKIRGKLVEIAVTPAGSSLIQAWVDAFPEEVRQAARAELLPVAPELALNDNAVYSLRRILESNSADLHALFQPSRTSDDYWVQMCTKSLHTRRFVEFALETDKDVVGPRLVEVADRRLLQLASTKQGSFVAQHLIDNVSPPLRAQLMRRVRESLRALIADRHAQFLVSHVLETAKNQDEVADVIGALGDPHTLLAVVSHRYGSTCVERLLKQFPEKVSPIVASGMLAMDDASLVAMANDPFGNYVVQTFSCHATAPHCAPVMARLGTLATQLTFASKIFSKSRPNLVAPTLPATVSQSEGHNGGNSFDRSKYAGEDMSSSARVATPAAPAAYYAPAATPYLATPPAFGPPAYQWMPTYASAPPPVPAWGGPFMPPPGHVPMPGLLMNPTPGVPAALMYGGAQLPYTTSIYPPMSVYQQPAYNFMPGHVPGVPLPMAMPYVPMHFPPPLPSHAQPPPSHAATHQFVTAATAMPPPASQGIPGPFVGHAVTLPHGAR